MSNRFITTAVLVFALLSGSAARCDPPAAPAQVAPPKTDAEWREWELADARAHKEGRKNLDQGYASLYALEPEAAIDAFTRVINGEHPWALGGSAAYGIAWAHVIQGDFGGAAEWMNTAVRRYPDQICEVAQQGQEYRAAELRRVWLPAALPPELAEPAVRRYQARKALDVSEDRSGPMSKEASLVLGINLLKARKLPQARYYFKRATIEPPGKPVDAGEARRGLPEAPGLDDYSTFPAGAAAAPSALIPPGNRRSSPTVFKPIQHQPSPHLPGFLDS